MIEDVPKPKTKQKKKAQAEWEDAGKVTASWEKVQLRTGQAPPAARAEAAAAAGGGAAAAEVRCG